MPGQTGRNTRQSKADEEARIAAEVRRRRVEQQQTIQAAADRLEDALRSVRENRKKCERFASHLAGFYEEVDKLAKGKALLEATDLIVEHANNIVREAKTLIKDDPYLEQVKEFVPAGDNPVYPDVVVVARTVQQAVERFASDLKSQQDVLAPRLREARTILGALRFFTTEDDYVATKADVATLMDNPSDDWFHGPYGNERFNFTRLDNRDIVAHLTSGITASVDEQE